MQEDFTGEQPCPVRATEVYILTGISLVLFAAACSFIEWQGNAELHTNMELVATGVAVFVCVLSLVRYYARRESLYLLIGLAYFGTATLDFYHTIVTSRYFSAMFPSALDSLIPWSWNASRTFLAGWLVFSVWALKYEEREGGPFGVHHHFYGLAAACTVLVLCLFALVPLPRAYYPELFLGRPEELISAICFLIAGFGFRSREKYSANTFEQALLLSIVIGFVTQATVMSRSFQLFDVMFDLAHTLKVVSYSAVLLGLLYDIYVLYKSTSTYLQKTLLELVEEKSKGEKIARAKTKFLVDVTNDLVVPVSGILSKAETAQDEAADSGVVKECLQDIERTAVRLNQFIMDICAVISIDTGRMNTANLLFQPTAEISKVLAIVKHRFSEKGVELVIEPHFPLPAFMRGDKSRFKQVVMNLLCNVLAATSEDTIIMSIACSQQDRLLKITIKDVTKKNLKDAGDSTLMNRKAPLLTESLFCGAGLSFSLASSLVALIGGTLDVRSNLQSGKQRFELTIPLGESDFLEWITEDDFLCFWTPPETASNLSPAELRALSIQGKVLVVEDPRSPLGIIREYVRSTSVQVSSVSSELEHTDFPGSGSFDLIFVDFEMPDNQGLRAAGLLRNTMTEVPIIAVSEEISSSTTIDAVKVGCDYCISKSFTKLDFFSILERYLTVGGAEVALVTLNGELGADELVEFESILNTTVYKFKRCLETGDWNGILKQLRKVKEVSRQNGAMEIYLLIKELEEVALDRQVESFKELINLFNELVDGIRVAAANERKVSSKVLLEKVSDDSGISG